MNRLELKLKELNPNLFGKLKETCEEVKLLMTRYIDNFPTYTDHSIEHTTEVFNIVDEILTDDELDNLNDDEIYILSMASYLHDIGMCIPEDKIKLISDTEDLLRERELHPEIKREDYLRNIHHSLSNRFIMEEWETLKIPTERYAKAIALVCEGHRQVDLGNPDIYNPKFFVKNGRDFVCLPYLAALLRIADELDVTNIRTPKLLTKYYMPDNEKSVQEWKKHIVNTLRNISENYVRFEVECSNHSMLASLEDQFNKIKSVINYCQKIIRNISNTENRKFSLKLEKVIEEYKYINFDPKGIRYSFDVDNVINAFIGENLYNDKLTSLREVIQNSIDTCRYKKTLNPDNYDPEITIIIERDFIRIEDNGVGMDEFIIKNFFGKLGSSFYQQENIKKKYEAIGQFGVGVFSYFLMADYIDIETKTDKSEVLHFRLDKDPKNYFHFFNTSKRSDSGTSITLYLKDYFSDKSTDIYISYIKDKFRFVEFPLKIISNNTLEVLEKQPLIFKDIKKIIQENIRYGRRENINEIDVLFINFNSEKYEGSLVYPYFKDFSFRNVLNSIYMNNIINEDKHERSRIEISQKGVFVNNYPSTLIDGILGKINLKHKIIDLQINRNGFSDNEQFNLFLDEINNEFVFQLFYSIKDQVDESELPKISYSLISNVKYEFSKNNINPFLEYTFIKLIQDNKERILLLKDFINLDLEFLILLAPQYLEMLQKTNLPIIELYSEDGDFDGSYQSYVEIFKLSGYKEEMKFNYDVYYSHMSKGKNINSLMLNNSSYDFIETNFYSILVDPYYLNNYNGENFSYYVPKFNLNHSFLKTLYPFLDEYFDENIKLKYLIGEIFGLINAFPFYDKNEELDFDYFPRLNNLITELENQTGIKYTFSVKDFKNE